jgi:uncharacterized repeat protein (TIGR01451 family)
MKYIGFITLLIIMFGQKAYSQCPADTLLLFTSQTELDAFLVEYPNCTAYQGDVEISGDDITHFQGLQNLIAIGGDFFIYENLTLSNMSGLENLTTVGGYFKIGSNTALTSLNGLENLTNIGGFFSIDSNTALTNLSGLENLATVGDGFALVYNIELTSLSALENLSAIGGALRIYRNYALTSLSGLENLTTIPDFLFIEENSALSSLNGLNNLASIGGEFVIQGNFVPGTQIGLDNLSGLENLTSIGGYFSLTFNNDLTSLNGLENLTSIGGGLSFSFNGALINLNGLQNLTSIGGGLSFHENAGLSSISELENLTAISGDLKIYGSPNLSFCHLPFVCDYLVNGNGTVEIYNNAPGCDSANEILDQCDDIGTIYLHYFYDENENAIQDNNEAYLPMLSAGITPGNYTLPGNPNGAAIKYLYYGGYTVTINENDLWNLSTSNTTFNIILDSLNSSDTLYFGFIPNSFISDLSTTCVNGLPRCNEFVLFEPMLTNNGTTTANGILWFEADENVLDVAFVDTPDTIIGSHKYGWFFTDLFPQHVFKKSISLQLPGPPVFPIGDFLTFNISAHFSDQITSERLVFNTHEVEVQCSYDPNDKLVSPIYPDNYALTGENLIYTIRFQNTGNAEAYDVVIKDLLSDNLDISTFRFITSSHESVLNTYLNDRMLTFEFRDIFLPDSTTNFDASQGYVMYSIRALDGLADFSTIENTANIFFDYNPAVITNTTENVMVESFDADGDGFEVWLDCEDNNAEINPANSEISYNSLDDDCNTATLDDDLDQDGFNLADDCEDNNAFINPAAEEIPNNSIDEDCDGADLILISDPGNELEIFPNPTTGVLHIIFREETSGNYELRDMAGRLILKDKLSKETELDISHLPQGVYILLLKSNEERWEERVVKL